MRPKNFQELLRAAKDRPDLLSALSSIGVERKRVGRSRYGEQYKVSTVRGIEGDLSSVVFCANDDGSWVAIDNKERTGRKTLDAIGVLTQLFGMDFDSAVYALTGTSPVESRGEYRAPVKVALPAPAAPAEPFVLPEKVPQSSWKGVKYLTKERLIPEPIIRTLFDQGVIYMPTVLTKDKMKKICCVGFKVLDETGKVVGCEADATYVAPGRSRFKMILENSDQRYGFHFKNNVDRIDPETPVYYCESAVDAISLLALKNLPGVYVSMSGVKDMLLRHMTDAFGGSPVICTDNDDGGNRFRRKFPEYATLIPEYGKDWNDELRYRVVHGLDYALKGESTLTKRDIQEYMENAAARSVKPAAGKAVV